MNQWHTCSPLFSALLSQHCIKIIESLSISWTILLPYMCTLSWPFAVNFMKLPETSTTRSTTRGLDITLKLWWHPDFQRTSFHLELSETLMKSTKNIKLIKPRTLKLVWLTSSYCVFMSSTSHQPKQASYQVVMFLLIFNKVGRKQVGFVYSNHFLSKGWKNGVQTWQKLDWSSFANLQFLSLCIDVDVLLTLGIQLVIVHQELWSWGEKGVGQHLENKNLNDLNEKHGYKIRFMLNSTIEIPLVAYRRWQAPVGVVHFNEPKRPYKT